MNKELEPNLHKLQPTRQGSWLKKLLPQINELIANGVLRSSVVTHLQEQGFVLSLQQLDKALYRWRKVHKPQVSSPTSKPAVGNTALSKPSLGFQTNPSPVTGDITSKSDLARLRDSDVPDLNALAALARQNRKEKQS